MKDMLGNMEGNAEEILNTQISGFHRYVLTKPAHLCYASRNLCEMIGASQAELLNVHVDGYAALLHPSDRAMYDDLLARLKQKEQTLCAEYRLIKKDGTVLRVRDTLTSQYMADGRMTASSVLTDITDFPLEKDDMQLLGGMVPFGCLKYTCEKQPRITYINGPMQTILRFPREETAERDELELYRENIFLMIPVEERRRFSKYLGNVYTADAPIAGEMTLLRCDGTKVHVFGWVAKSVNERGEAEFQSICMDITDQYLKRKAKETARYLKGLTDVYQMIFEFHLDANTVKCLHCDETSSFKKFANVTLQTGEALENWLIDSVEDENRENMRAYFADFLRNDSNGQNERPTQIRYQARASDGRIKTYMGIFIKVDESISFYCCREVQDTAALKDENIRLKEGMRDLVMRFSDGLAAFEVLPDGRVKPLYASENVSDFFGYTKEEWLLLTEKYTPMESFVRYSGAAYEHFAELLKNGEAEFAYYDNQTGAERRIKAVLSQKEPSEHVSRYVMLYSVEDTPCMTHTQQLSDHQRVLIRTFGYFDVFVGEKPIAFSNKKAKELLALLVDRRGGYVTSEEAIGFLWEDEPANTLTYARYRKVALRLKNTLEAYGAAHIMDTVDGKRRIVTEHVECDLYQYLSDRKKQPFGGSYLTNYSWGETTLGELICRETE